MRSARVLERERLNVSKLVEASSGNQSLASIRGNILLVFQKFISRTIIITEEDRGRGAKETWIIIIVTVVVVIIIIVRGR